MFDRHCRRHAMPSGIRAAGFTLIEMLVALAVIGVAVSVFVSLYGKSRELGRRSVNRAIATELAQAQLAAIVDSPEQFLWEFPEEPGRRFPIRSAADDPPAGNPFAPPVIPPVEPDAKRRVAQRYTQFRWSAQGRLPAPGANHYEVSVVVHWEEAQRPQTLALTSAVPRLQLDTRQEPAPAPAEDAEKEKDGETAPDEPAAAEAPGKAEAEAGAGAKATETAAEEAPAGAEPAPETKPAAPTGASTQPQAQRQTQEEERPDTTASPEPEASPATGAAQAIQEVLQ